MYPPNLTDTPKSSFLRPQPPPGVEAGCTPLSTVWIPTSLIPLVLGALLQLLPPWAWNTATPATTQAQMRDLLTRIAVASQTAYNIPVPISCDDASCDWIDNGAGSYIVDD